MVRSVPTTRPAVLAVCLALVLASFPVAPTLAQSSEPSGTEEVSAPASQAHGPDAWPSTQLEGAHAIIAADGRFVAVGSDGSFPGRAHAWTSTDGVAWQPATVTSAPDGTVMTSVTATDTGFVALGTAMSDPTGGPDRVAAWHSTDGQSWDRATVQRPARRGLGAGVRSVAAGPAGLLALATFFGQEAGPFRLYHSADGEAWAPVPLPGANSATWSGVVAVPDGYLLVGSSRRGRPATFRSSDGQTWQRVTTSPRLLDAAAGADGTIVGIDERRIWSTPDLVSWQEVPVGPGAADDAVTPALDFLAWDGTQFAVSGISHAGCPENVDECYQRSLLLSADGTTWTETAGPDGVPGPDPSMWIGGIASADGTTVVLGESGPGPVVAWRMEGDASSATDGG